MSSFVSFSGGVRLARSRLSALSVGTVTVAGVGLTALAAVAEHSVSPAHAPARALQGPAFGLGVPLVTMAIVALFTGHDNLRSSTKPLAWLGADRRSVVVGMVVVGAAVAAGINVLVGVGTALLAHGGHGGGMWTDAGTAAWVAVLASLTYASLFTFASTIGRKGGWRSWAWLADLWLGTMTGYGAVIAPRAHTLNLLGGPCVGHLSQASSAAALLLLAAIFLTASLLKIGK